MKCRCLGLVVGLVTLIGGCGSGKSGQQKPGDAPGPNVQPAAPPVTFTLMANGLPRELSWKCDPVFADVNGDGKLDLIGHPRLGDGPRVWLGDGKGNWRDSSEGLAAMKPSCGGGVRIADVNRDGHPDLILADHCHGLYVYLGDGTGRWELAIGALYPVDVVTDDNDTERFIGAESLAVGDVNNDGFLDIVAGGSDSGGLSVYLGDGSGRNWFRVAGELPTTGWAPRLQLVDMNQDGNLDLLASTNDGPRVWLGDGTGHWRPASEGLPTPQVGGIYVGIGAGDVNEDGRLDLICSNMFDGPEVYLQQADGSWEKTADVFPDMMGGAFGLALGDLNGDGHLDMVVSGRLKYEVGFVYGVFLLLGDGKTHWQYVANSGLPETGLGFTWGVALGDFDGDGVLDVATGTGGKVATVPGRTEPVLAERMLVWKTNLASKGQTGAGPDASGPKNDH